MTIEALMKSLDNIEAELKTMDTKAAGELATLGKVTADTKTALEQLGTEQRTLADRLTQLEQKGVLRAEGEKPADTWGAQFCKSEQYKAFAGGQVQKMRVEVKNTVTNTVANTAPERRPGIVSGAFRQLTLEARLVSVPTSSNAVEFVRESVFTNAAAETAEGAPKPESGLTTTLENVPVATVAHWLKISRQLAADNAALVAYINLRMRYGVDLRVENQILAGNGTSPNMHGFLKVGNHTAHGYTAAQLQTLGLANNGFDLIGLMIGDTQAGDFPADTILLNPTDWWKLRLTKDGQGRYLLGDPGMDAPPVLFNRPVEISSAVPVGNVAVAALAAAGTFHDREAVTIDMSESDGDNFTKNLVTIRAERRCMLAVERPLAFRYGPLKPAAA
ncbi:phage major capsid protein [Eleftheria terrae]|uniref:phage major capsid protein n=1 Tax=Eleftheria terrae TaxID=1597781 RepID=UPI00263A9543|nr:phage major capsid protein [Eleftheria terrae]WKB52305.1 phage major capsid protein [Eleftheria terrae]